jgi:hypothetical protein
MKAVFERSLEARVRIELTYKGFADLGFQAVTPLFTTAVPVVSGFLSAFCPPRSATLAGPMQVQEIRVEVLPSQAPWRPHRAIMTAELPQGELSSRSAINEH